MRAEEDIAVEEEVAIPLTERELIRRQIVHGVLDILGLSDWVSYSKVMQQVFFVLFILGIGVFHVYNAHLAEGMIRSIAKTEREIKDLKWEYMSIKSDLMMRSKLSDVEKAVEPYGLKSAQQPPYTIVVQPNEY